MPLYMCNAVEGMIQERAKQKIAEDITDIHCEITGDPRTNVHVFFFDDAPAAPIDGKSVLLFANLNKGSVEGEQKSLESRIKASIFAHAGVGLAETLVDVSDAPATWQMEGANIQAAPDQTGWHAAAE